MKPFAIRRAAANDAGAIAALVNRAFQVEAFFIEKDRTNAAEVAAMLMRGVFLLAEAAGALAGCVLVKLPCRFVVMSKTL